MNSNQKLKKMLLLKNNVLNYRSQNLSSQEINEVINNLKSAADQDESNLSSLSFSYNSSFGNEGAIELTKLNLQNLTVIGLVSCNIEDEGGVALLKWFQHMPQMTLICIEQNNFSMTVKSEFRAFGSQNPNLLMVV